MRCLIAMSGGVDSSVAAYLLKEAGYEVIGVTLRIWEDFSLPAGQKICGGYQSILDAQLTAAKLKIPYYLFDVREEFKHQVVNSFIDNYFSGKTPNPCVLCNQWIKFKVLLKKAQELNCEKIATGHYARIEFDTKKNRWLLKRVKYKEYDQTYFLYSLTQNELARTLFPLGDKTKKEVRAIARKLSLPTAEKKKSQEICFIPEKNYGNFILKISQKTPNKGPVFDSESKIIGTHQGIIYYTIGQRKRIGIPHSKRLYVTKIDPEKNAIYVGEEKECYFSGLVAKNLNFIPFKKLTKPLRILAQIRNVHKPSLATIELKEKELFLYFDEPQWAITPGQAVVFYDENDELVIGGGEIVANF